jgi:hypothetical protein
MNECSFEKVTLLTHVRFKINPVHAFTASNLHLVFPRKLFPSCCSTKILCLFLILPACVSFPDHFIFLDEIIVTMFGEEYILCTDIPAVEK